MEEVDEKVKLALDMSKLSLPDKPVVEAVEVFPYVDTVGKDALEIYVIISESTQLEEITGKAVMQIKRSIRENLQKNGIFLFPFTHFFTRSEFEARNHVE